MQKKIVYVIGLMLVTSVLVIPLIQAVIMDNNSTINMEENNEIFRFILVI